MSFLRRSVACGSLLVVAGSPFVACGGQIDNGIFDDAGGGIDAAHADSAAHFESGSFESGSYDASFRDATPRDAAFNDVTFIDASNPDTGFDSSGIDASVDSAPDVIIPIIPDTGTFDGGTPLFDSIPMQSGSSSRGIDDACGTNIVVHVTTTISFISVKNALASAGNIKFLIFNGGVLVYSSAPKAFPASGDSWKESDPLSFTLQAGQTYDITGISDTAGSWDYDTVVENTAAISSTIMNPNVSGYATPALGTRGGADCGIRLYP